MRIAVAGGTGLVGRHVSNATTPRRGTSVAFFTPGTENLLAAGQRAGVRHHVVLSIGGVDRVDVGDYAGKRRQEELVLAGPVPGSVVRDTQFHEFPGQLLARMRGPLALVPRMAPELAGAAGGRPSTSGLTPASRPTRPPRHGDAAARVTARVGEQSGHGRNATPRPGPPCSSILIRRPP